MRGMWRELGWAGAVALGLAGCVTTDERPKPSPNPEEFILPPANDPRFTQPPTFPTKTLNQDAIRKDRDKEDGVPSGFRGGSRPGMGGGGY